MSLFSGKLRFIGGASEATQVRIQDLLSRNLEVQEQMLEELRRIRLGLSILTNEELGKEHVDAE